MTATATVTKLVPMRAHPVADIFPLMGGTDFDAFVNDIRGNGQREPIVLHKGLIIDGRNRWRACQILGIEPYTIEWNGGGSIDTFIISHNLHRRHLTAAQRAMVAGRLANIRHGDVGRNHPRNSDRDVSISEAARLMNVSESVVHQARNILLEGTEQEIADASSGVAGVMPMAKRIRDRRPGDRKRKKSIPAARHPERIARMGVEAEIWAQLSDALDRLTGLPLPSEVADIVRKNNGRTRMVEAKLNRSLNWLEEFNRAFTRSQE